ncbi:hypothetical protein IKF74_01910 [Candidatus Saccharibacteria bacterium]|nr:hypothetical protein [Candidatus Saccharibacteria bacterium]
MATAHEEAKYKDYVKHINWIYHKTQVPPKVILMGKNSETVPLRHYKLRICEIARLDSSKDAPPKSDLFDDFRQKNAFEDITTEALIDDSKLAHKYLGTNNVVILDDYVVVTNRATLVEAIVKGETFLTDHGRFLFDLPIGITISEPAVAIGYILSVAREANANLRDIISSSRFLVEDIKLTVDQNATGVLGLRVYLKKTALT